jgi:hypothetical protein
MWFATRPLKRPDVVDHSIRRARDRVHVLEPIARGQINKGQLMVCFGTGLV